MNTSDPTLLDWTMRVLTDVDEMLQQTQVFYAAVADGREKLTPERAASLMREGERARAILAQHLQAGRQLQAILAPVPRERMM